jgi:predicted translin family RNA/ssDNA-binding protein
MTAAGVQDRDLKAAEYLQSLRSMTGELERAMQAIARNALPEFEESIDSQQVLSARLARLADDLCAPLQAKTVIARAAIDEDMMRQIRSADETLQRLNQRYTALLQHSSRSVALMASLFSSFQGQFQEASGPRLKHQTWSCQM